MMEVVDEGAKVMWVGGWVCVWVTEDHRIQRFPGRCPLKSHHCCGRCGQAGHVMTQHRL